jgi:hypothetical protein
VATKPTKIGHRATETASPLGKSLKVKLKISLLFSVLSDANPHVAFT